MKKGKKVNVNVSGSPNRGAGTIFEVLLLQKED